jgi:hypothetical protein
LIITITVAIAQPRSIAAVHITRAIFQGVFWTAGKFITVTIVIAIACQVTTILLINAITVAIAHPRGWTAITVIRTVLNFLFSTFSVAVAILLTIA